MPGYSRFEVNTRYGSARGEGVLFSSGRSVIDWDDRTMTTFSDEGELQDFIHVHCMDLRWWPADAARSSIDGAAFALARAMGRRSRPDDIIEAMAEAGAHVHLDRAGEALWRQAQRHVLAQSNTALYPMYRTGPAGLETLWPSLTTMAQIMEDEENRQAEMDTVKKAASIGIDLAAGGDLTANRVKGR